MCLQAANLVRHLAITNAAQNKSWERLINEISVYGTS